MRNYRIITKQNNIGAWGSGRSQAISPVKDSIIFKINREDFNLFDRVLHLTDSVAFAAVPNAPHFNLHDTVMNVTDEMNITYE